MQTIATVFFLFWPRLNYEITVVYCLLTVMKFKIFLVRIIKIFLVLFNWNPLKNRTGFIP